MISHGLRMIASWRLIVRPSPSGRIASRDIAWHVSRPNM